MSRPLILSNGRMLVGLDQYGLVHDLYYPYVGLENHANARGMHHRVGIWVDNQFSWLDDGNWTVSINYETDLMVGVTTAVHAELAIQLEFHDFVDCEHNTFGRNITVTNQRDSSREIRLFMHQVFHISNSDGGDTAVYMPEERVIMDYKGSRAFAIHGHTDEGTFDQYSIGVHGIEGKEGTYRDAEDGELGNNPVEHGSIDSVLRFVLHVDDVPKVVNYWISAGPNTIDALKSHAKIANAGLESRLKKTREYWKSWLLESNEVVSRVSEEYRHSFVQNLFILKAHIDVRGSVLASSDSEMLNYARDNYSYCWPRDAVYALWPLIRLGYFQEAKNFFGFCRDVLSEGGYLMHKYQPDRALGSSWHPYIHDRHYELPIQEDETASVIFLIGEFYKLSGDEDYVRKIYASFVRPAATFIEEYIDSATKLPHASYDLWEEKFLTSTYTTAVTYGGLVAAAELAEAFEYPDEAIRWRTVADDIREHAHKTFFNEDKQYFHKGFLLNSSEMMEFDDTVDTSSLFGALMFGLYEHSHPHVAASLTTLEKTLVDYSPSKGVPRYENDRYNATNEQSLGNPWFVTSLWYAQHFVEKRSMDKAHEIVRWVQSRMMPSGVLSEQIDPDSGEYISVAPLVWSQAEFLSTVLDITDEAQS